MNRHHIEIRTFRRRTTTVFWYSSTTGGRVGSEVADEALHQKHDELVAGVTEPPGPRNHKKGEIAMNRTTSRLTTVVLVALSFALTPFDQPTAARSERMAKSTNSNCKEVKGNLTVEFGAGTANGEIINGNVLNGTFATAFTPGSVVPTADPTSITFTGDSTISTDKGVLATHDVYLFDLVSALGPGMLRIDSTNSTGEFAGATGILYLNPNFGDPPGHAQLSGKICLADQ
jgi:hypothetical protein